MLRTCWIASGAVIWMLAMPTARADDLEHRSVRDRVGRGTARLAESDAPTIRRGRTGFDLELRTAYMHQLETSLDDGGELSVDRFAASARIGFTPRKGLPVAVALNYRLDAHNFGGAGRTFPARPWGDVHFLSATMPLFIPTGDRWSVRIIPTIRTAFEDGAPWGDGFAGGGIFGVAYKVNRCLTIGPALGVISQIEDDPLIFPFLFIDWKIREGLHLRSGRGLAATQGFGVFLEWRPTSRWRFALGGRADQLRFRLDGRGVAPGGVGEHSGTLLFLAATLRCGRRAECTLSIGSTLGGNLRVEDRAGALLQKDDYAAAPFIALDFQLDL